MYRYLFYRLYRFGEAAPSRWWSEWKAAVVLTALEVIAGVTLIGVIEVLLRRSLLSGAANWYVILFVLVLAALKYRMFIDDDLWREHAVEFEQMPNRDRKKLNALFWLIVLAVPTCYVLMLRLVSITDWHHVP